MRRRLCLAFAIVVALSLTGLPRGGAAPILPPGVFSISGEIREAMVEALAATPVGQIDRLELSSRGGDFFAALHLSWIVHERGLATVVRYAGDCFSACTVIFQAGRERIAHPTASFLYHSVVTQLNGRTYVNAAWTRLLKDSLKHNGADPTLIARIGERPFLLEAREAAPYGVVTKLDSRL
jgi:ATP-dependent protease ClpP protease subunit